MSQAPHAGNLYQICLERSKEVLADDLTIEGVDAWWKANEDEYFGLAKHDCQIIVARTPALDRAAP